jgi:ABC-type sugar transport system ATPase subunit
MAFQEKSFTKMKSIKQSGCAILFVSHSISAVRNFCDRAIWLNHGTIKACGAANNICEAYAEHMNSKNIKVRDSSIVMATGTTKGAIEQRGMGTIILKSISLNKTIFEMGDTIEIAFAMEIMPNAPSYGIGIIIRDSKTNIATIINTIRDDIEVPPNRREVRLRIPDHRFGPGDYRITISICDTNAMFSYHKIDDAVSFSVPIKRNKKGIPQTEGTVRCDHEWL